ncbi:MAG: hypothetical protein O2820_24275 [Planctomycetota bacterium]|nr:hypothetical protein [Planctomycetota bacterium]MDA1252332.1 hypothetical protein [Planctomycetota bacterium]
MRFCFPFLPYFPYFPWFLNPREGRCLLPDRRWIGFTNRPYIAEARNQRM